MLLFILVEEWNKRALADSNTSHVIVYHQTFVRNKLVEDIQIHLMLLFIYCQDGRAEGRRKFKYISCYCLSVCRGRQAFASQNSNTSHVIVYLLHSVLLACDMRIQIHLMLLFICMLEQSQLHLVYSNTSHVIVYRGPSSGLEKCRKFKYISCYCLSYRLNKVLKQEKHSNTSHVIVYRILEWLRGNIMEFKYISCYCLS